MNSSPRVSIIILNWNGWGDTIECLESVYRIEYPNYDVIVVDNGSQDDSVKRIKEYAQGKLRASSKFFEYNPENKPIKVFELTGEEARCGKFDRPLYEKYDPNRRLILLKNRSNHGFAGGNNIGMEFALSVFNPEYILLLNNDTVVESNLLEGLVKAADERSKIGVIGPKVVYYDDPSIINSAGAMINWKLGLGVNIGIGEEDKGQHDRIRSVESILGACMLIRREALYNAGLFDGTFFILLEDTDLCLKVRNAGYEVLYYPHVRVFHKEGMTRGTASSMSLYYQNKNRILFLKKYSEKWLSYVILREIIGVVWVLFREKSLEKAVSIFLGLVDGIKS